MNIDTYQKIAIGVCARLEGKKPFSLVLTSSDDKVACLPVGEGVAKALSSIQYKTVLVDATKDGSKLTEPKAEAWGISCTSLIPGDAALSLEQARAIVDQLNSSYDAAVIVTRPLAASDTAMLLTTAAGNVVFTERRKVSRTDRIDAAMDAARTLGALPVGFIVE